jgi:hypothetical protein
MTASKPSLANLTFMGDVAAPSTREEKINALLREDAEVKSQIDRLTQKRADLKELIKALGEDAFERWYFQEHGEDMAELRQKEAKRQERRAAIEDQRRSVEERRARMTPEAQAKFKASIAGLKECTKEELRQEAIDAQIKAKQDRAALRRWKNGNGHASEEGNQC